MLKQITLSIIILATSSVQAQSCDWNNPGANPYTGSLSSAVDSYPELSSEAKKVIKQKINSNAYDDHVKITKDLIQGKEVYTSASNMHFGNGKCKGEVNTSKWKPSQNVQALVYCHKEECVIRPQICNNISLISKMPSKGSNPASEAFTSEGDALVAPEHVKGTESVLAIPKDTVTSIQQIAEQTPPAAEEASFSDKLLPWLGALAGFLGGSAVVNASSGSGLSGSTSVVNPPKVDDLVVTAVPEPSIYGMILVGIVFMVFVYKRKKD